MRTAVDFCHARAIRGHPARAIQHRNPAGSAAPACSCLILFGPANSSQARLPVAIGGALPRWPVGLLPLTRRPICRVCKTSMEDLSRGPFEIPARPSCGCRPRCRGAAVEVYALVNARSPTGERARMWSGGRVLCSTARPLDRVMFQVGCHRCSAYDEGVRQADQPLCVEQSIDCRPDERDHGDHPH